jgi:DNA-directed RNA polymerase specialized sigma24 family protein
VSALADSTLAPDAIATIVENLQQQLAELDEDLREIVLLRLEGYTRREIAQRLRRSEATIERRLRLIRDRWTKEMGNE